MVLTDLNLVLLAIAASNLPPCDSQVTPVPEENSTTTEPVTAIMDNIPPNYRKVTVIASEENSATLTKVLRRIEVPAAVNSVELRDVSRGLDTRVPNDLVVVMDDEVTAETVLNSSLWRGDTKFLVVSRGRDIEGDFRGFWGWNAMNVFALVGDSVYTYRPYHNGTCDMSRPILVDVWTGGAFRHGGSFIANEGARLKDLNGCRVNISTVEVKPSSLYAIDEYSSETMDGIEARYLSTLAEKLNFAPMFAQPSDRRGWGAAVPTFGVLGEVYQKVSHFGIGFIGPLPIRHFYFDLSRPYNGKECVTFVVPAAAGRDDLAWLHNISAGLRLFWWSFILASLLIVIAILCFAGQHTFMTAFMYSWTALMSQSIELPNNRGLKYMMASWIICCTFVTGIYQASLGSRMTVPLKPPEIETIDDLLDSDLTVLGHPLLRKFYENAKEYANVVHLSQRLLSTEMKIEEALSDIIAGRRIAFLSQSIIIEYAMVQVPNANDYARTLAECITSYQAVIVLQKNSPFDKALDDVIWRMAESGIGPLWKSDFMRGRPLDQPKFVPFKLRQSFGVFAILAAGLSASSLSFLVELGLGYAKGHFRRSKKDQKPNN